MGGNTEEPIWRLLSQAHDPEARYSSNPRLDLLSLIDHKVVCALELGCGAGATGKVLKKKYPLVHLVGVEGDRVTAMKAQDVFDTIHIADLNSLDFSMLGWRREMFDLVIAGDVLEHIINPWFLLEQLRFYLKSDCRLLVSLPNIANATIISNLAAGRWEYESEGLLDVTHLRFFTRTTAIRLLTETSYTIEKMARTIDARVSEWPAGSEASVCNLDLNDTIQLKNVTLEHWEDLRTLQYLFLARLKPLELRSWIPGWRIAEPIKVACLSADHPTFACGQIRIVSPFRELQKQGFQFCWAAKVLAEGRLHIDMKLLSEADLIIVQRFFPTPEMRDVLSEIKSMGKPIIYETDDLLTHPPSGNPHAEALGRARESIESCIRSADLVVVSTTKLKTEIQPLNQNIEVIPNYLDERIWAFDKENTSKHINTSLRILCAGTLTHTQDYALIFPVLQQLKALHEEHIRYIFMGIDPPDELDLGEVEIIDFQSGYQAYARELQRLSVDLAVVPLLDNPFNQAKSSIKFLEYSILGVPGVYSDILPYQSIHHRQTGLKVPNTQEAWFAALDELIRNPGLRHQLAVAARAEVMQHWMLSQHIDEIAKVYRSLIEGTTPRAVQHPASDEAAKIKETKSLTAINQEATWAKEETLLPVQSLAVIIRGLPDSKEDLRETAHRLAAQWISPDKVTLNSDPDLLALNRLVAEMDTDWILFLRTGDVCDPALIAILMRAINHHPEWRLVYFDETQLDDEGESVNPFFKPDFNLDYLRSMPYTGNTFAVCREAFTALEGFDPYYEGIEEYDFLLRISEYYGEAAIGHVSGPLISHRPAVNLTCRPLDEVLTAGRDALIRHFKRTGVKATVEPGELSPANQVRYCHDSKPLVSILIPTRNQFPLLERCIKSLFEKTGWPHFEILIIDNGSDEPEAMQFLDGLRQLGEELGGRIRVLDYPQPFNYSAMNNQAAHTARGEYLLLLNNDTAALHAEWLDHLMMHALRPEVGIVGAKLLYPDGKIQHAGVVLGLKGPAEHPFIGQDASDPGYFGRLQVDQAYSAVTGACLLVRRSLYEAVGGLDEKELGVSYSDIDLCLKIRALGKKIIWTPQAILLHEGSKSQTAGVEKAEENAKAKRFQREQAVMYRRWLPQLAADPAYNRFLSLADTNFQEETDPALHWDPAWRPVPRIITQPADHMGCGEYRILAPTRALINGGLIQGEATDRIYTPVELARIKPDALVLQRQIEPHQIEAIKRHKQFNSVFCVFEIDDLLTNVPVKNVHKQHLPKYMHKRMHQAIRLCDRLVVATEPLAEAYAGLNDDIRVIPNYIEAARWKGFSPRRRAGRKPRVGWAGSISHTGDLELIQGVVEALANEVEWVFLGLCPERLRPFVDEFHPPVPLDDYPSKLASLNLDLALAPLEEVPFNHAKSHLRLLEYGILGYPVVCTDITPYRGAYPVTRVRNRYKDWVEAIRAHIDDQDENARQGDALREYVRQHGLLEQHLEIWMQGWLPDGKFSFSG